MPLNNGIQHSISLNRKEQLIGMVAKKENIISLLMYVSDSEQKKRVNIY